MTAARRTAIALPDLGTESVAFSLWYVRNGERVLEGDRVAEVLIRGATFDVPASATGILVEQEVFPSDRLNAGQTLGWILENE